MARLHPWRTAGRRAFGRYALIFPLLLFVVWVPLQFTRIDRHAAYFDSEPLHHAAGLARTGRALYAADLASVQHHTYPPFLAPALALLPPVPLETFGKAWVLAMVLAYWVWAASLARLATGGWSLRPTLVVGAALWFVPLVPLMMGVHNADVMICALIALAWASRGARGPALVSAVMLKTIGAWPLATLMLRDRRTRVSAALTAAIGCAIAVASLGPGGVMRATAGWLDHVAPMLADGAQSVPAGASVRIELLGWGIPNRLPVNVSLPLLALQSGGPTIEPLSRNLLLIAALVAPLGTAWLTRRARPLTQAGWVLAASLFFAPFVRPTYLLVLLAPLADRLGKAAHRGSAASASSAPPTDLPVAVGP